MNAIAVYKLEEAGFKRNQVEALAEFLDTQAVTKLDLEKATHQLQQEIAAVRTELKQDTAELKQEMAILRGELNVHRWILGFNTALLLGVLLKLFLP
jgi:uncharacterized membrane protein YccC